MTEQGGIDVVEEVPEIDDAQFNPEEIELDESDDEVPLADSVSPQKRPDTSYFPQKQLISTLPEGYAFDIRAAKSFGLNPQLRISLGMLGAKKDSSSVDWAEAESLNEFSRAVRQFPLLNKELEQIIFTYRDNGNTISDLRRDPKFWEAFGKTDPEQIQLLLDSSSSLRDLVINSNMRLVFKMASRYAGGLPMSDKVAEGAIGMQKAYEKFDVTKGFKFSTYATWWIRQSISRAIIDLGSTIRLPVHVAETTKVLKGLIMDFSGREGREPKFHELVVLAVQNGYEKQQIINIVQSAINGTLGEPTSLDMPVGDDGESTLGDFIGDSAPEANMIAAVFNSADRQAIQSAFQSLEPRERRILELRFGLIDGRERTLEEVGHEFGVTKERIRQVEAKAMRKLRANRGLARKRRVSDVVVEGVPRPVIKIKAPERVIETTAQRQLQMARPLAVDVETPLEPAKKTPITSAPEFKESVALDVREEVPQRPALNLLDDDYEAPDSKGRSIYEKVADFHKDNEFFSSE